MELRVKVGDKVSEGTAILTIAPSSDGGSPNEATAGAQEVGEAEQAEDAAAEEDAPAAPVPSEPAANGHAEVYASPSVRHRARELGVDLGSVQGSGRKGRITKEDLEGVPAAGPSVSPAEAADRWGPVEREPRSRINKIAAPFLERSWTEIPHVTHHEDADITELEAFRKRVNTEQDVKLTMVALLVKACVASLQAFPHVNASLEDEDYLLKRYWHIGFAADTPQGLVVPVIRDADRKGLLEIGAELRELSGRAREGKLKAEEMQGGTFTISSLGGIGGTGFTPIVNAPQVAILGVTRAATKPVWDGAAFAARLVVPLSLSYDHRAIDGAEAARFCAHLAGVLADFRRVLL
jgi:pyruvate dehydrogenase E2 component (dihydrolipoamide acetyltransferase)